MKKWLLLLIVLVCIPACFSCVTNSVQVNTRVALEPLQLFLIFEGSYNAFVNGSLYYYAHNDSSMNIRVNDESVTLHSLNETTNWTRIIGEELELLSFIEAVNLSSEEIIVLANLGCCGIYENGSFVVPRGCDERFTVPIVNNSSSWLAVLLAFLPGVLAAVYLVRNKWMQYLSFFLGGAGWFIALLLREPLLALIGETDLLVSILIASLLAGVFEEAVRYLLLKYVKNARASPVIFGLGWGVTEALLMYGATIAFLLLMNQSLTFSDVLPGAVERLIITGFHVSLTMIVFKALTDKRFLLLAIFLHFFANVIGSITGFILMWNLWIIEVLLFSTAAITAYIAYVLNKEVKHVRKRKKSAGRAKKRG